MMNKEMAIAKMINLQSALAECGIESEITEWENTTESGSTTKFVSLRAELWNCVHDGDVVFEVYVEDTDDYEEIQHYAESEYERDELFAKYEKNEE